MKPAPWPPAEYRLPDDLDEIEAGRPPRQLPLLAEPADDSRQGRLARLLADVPGVASADNLGVMP